MKRNPSIIVATIVTLFAVAVVSTICCLYCIPYKFEVTNNVTLSFITVRNSFDDIHSPSISKNELNETELNNLLKALEQERYVFRSNAVKGQVITTESGKISETVWIDSFYDGKLYSRYQISDSGSVTHIKYKDGSATTQTFALKGGTERVKILFDALHKI